MGLLPSFPRRYVPDARSRIAHSFLCTRRSTLSNTYRTGLGKSENKGKFRRSSYWHNTADQQATRPTCAQSLHNSGITKLRWRIERDYEELKQELGLGHFEGRNWRGFHHHATLVIAAYGFLVQERCLFPPSGNSSLLQTGDIRFSLPRLPSAFTPRGSAGKNRTA
jgi:SRSO17 transposase